MKVLNYYEHSEIKNQELPVEWQEQSSLDEFASFLQLNWEQRHVFFDDGEIKSKQQYLGFEGSKGLKTNKYIGTIVFKGQQLNIFPKVFKERKDDNRTDNLSLKHLMNNLVQWIQYCNRIDYPFINISGKLQDCDDLRELFITLYLHYVKRALEYGAFYRYEDKSEDLSVIKGQIDFKDYINDKIPSGQNHRFKCAYSEFEFDNAVSRIIKYTCKCLVNEVSKENRKLLRTILIKLNGVTDKKCTPGDCDNIRLSRLHRQYSLILSMSKMFLLNQTTVFTVGNHQSFCFLFPTDLLFEGFVGGYLAEVLQDNAHVRLQASDMPVFTDFYVGGVSQGSFSTMRHDILVETKDSIFILDTKYKEISRFSNTDPDSLQIIFQNEKRESDVYQMITYAYRRGAKDTYLLYPMYRFEEEDILDIYGESPAGDGTASIKVHFVRLPFVFEEDDTPIKESLKRVILKMFN